MSLLYSFLSEFSTLLITFLWFHRCHYTWVLYLWLFQMDYY